MTQSSVLPRKDSLLARLDELRLHLQKAVPESLAARSGARFSRLDTQQGEFLIDFWEQPVLIRYPDFEAHPGESRSPLAPFLQAMLLYYLATCDGTPAAREWISFSDLPDGRFYNHAFQGYTGRKLAAVFKNDLSAFQRASEKTSGRRMFSIGDAAYLFQVLPLVSLLVVAWLGDEEMPPAYTILFDANVSHHLPTDACAILGSMLTERLIKARQNPAS
jgi:hypothetical protein